MATYEDALTALNPFRVQLQHEVFADIERQSERQSVGRLTAFSAGGATSAFSTALTNIHATGVGVRIRAGTIVPDEFVIKVYVFEKLDLGAEAPFLTKRFGNIEIDVEPLPVQLAAARNVRHLRAPVRAPAAAIANRGQFRPIPGGVSISPLDARFVGTLGCFVRGVSAGAEQLFALSNNHVLADVDNLPTGTAIVQPGPEVSATDPDDVFAMLSNTVPLQFPTTRFERRINLFDAAIARVTDPQLISTTQVLGIPNYSAVLSSAIPGMPVTKSGRTTGVTTGMVTATHVNGVQVNYGTQANPRIAVFDGTIQIIGDDGQPFSLPGDSGSVIIERATGNVVALLFAGDGRTTTTCDLGAVCRQFQVIPT
ncbi:hypothetical protein [Bradyrhizobium sp. CCGB20]|uniref:hypothetical protein n=1 Tax=Bradyrhizobium sp. CCGB20 TaxID=2949633 RepID=UPI0020B24461|nr:hypothetical protein [Bradyrhizobium sp. CCGB20]MCP3402988.1 hypothetical protein [Bradyrhizobium sp. CCGB20]